MKEINPDYIIPMHCTSFRAIMAVQRDCRKSSSCLPRGREWSSAASSDPLLMHWKPSSRSPRRKRLSKVHLRLHDRLDEKIG
jgi:hypothetical protein